MTFANQQTGAKVEALKDINFTLKKGELLSVLGPVWLWQNDIAEHGRRFHHPDQWPDCRWRPRD
jgi:hypothetical protein